MLTHRGDIAVVEQVTHMSSALSWCLSHIPSKRAGGYVVPLENSFCQVYIAVPVGFSQQFSRK